MVAFVSPILSFNVPALLAALMNAWLPSSRFASSFVTALNSAFKLLTEPTELPTFTSVSNIIFSFAIII